MATMQRLGHTTARAERRGSWRWAAAAGVAAALVSTVGVGPVSKPTGTATAQPATCEQPYRQILVTLGGGPRDPEAHPLVVWPRRGVGYNPRRNGADLDLRQRWRDEGIDTDGDDKADVITGDIVAAQSGPDRQIVRLERGDGVLTLSLANLNLASMNDANLGDLDADGHDELLVLARPFDAGTDRYFVVAGTTPVGDHDLAEVAVEVEAMGFMGVGDQGGGAGDDVAVRIGDPTDMSDPAHLLTFIASGNQLMAGGPGSTATLVPVIPPYEGFPMSVVDLGDERPAIISGIPWETTDPSSSIRGLVLQRGGTLTRFNLSEPFDSVEYPDWGYPPRFSSATAVRYTFPTPDLQLELGGSDRGGSIRAAWRIDDPCLELPEAFGNAPILPGPTPAPAPADPRPGDAAYTG